MHRPALSLLPVLVVAGLATLGTRSTVASDTLLHLTGWAEIPSTVPLRTLRVQPCKNASTGARHGHDRDDRDDRGKDCR